MSLHLKQLKTLTQKINVKNNHNCDRNDECLFQKTNGAQEKNVQYGNELMKQEFIKLLLILHKIYGTFNHKTFSADHVCLTCSKLLRSLEGQSLSELP